MIQVSDEYKKASENTERKSYIIAKYGLYDKVGKTKINNVVANFSQPFSNIYKTYNDVTETNYNYISCEPNRCKLDGSFYFLNSKTNSSEKEKIALWGNVLSDSNGNFSGNKPNLIFRFSENLKLNNITLTFQEVVKSFRVDFYSNSTLVASWETQNNNLLIVETNMVISNKYYNNITITFLATKEPYRYSKFNELDIGVLEKFGDEQIADMQIIDEVSIDSSELSSNSLTLQIKNLNGEFDILNPNNKLSKLQERQEIDIFHYLQVNGAYQEIPLGTFLIKKFTPRKQVLEIEAYDDTYYMNQMYYGSRFYENAEITFILKDLFDYFDYTKYIIDEELEGIKLSGYVPNVEWREALRMICEAGCCVVSKNRQGGTYIYRTYDEPIKTFSKKLLFSEEPSKNLFNNVIDVVEYNFTTRKENEIIYSSELEIGTHTIIYNKYPILETTLKKNVENIDYEIIKAYATSCVVEVKQKTNVELKATYIEETNSVIRKNKSVVNESEDFAISKVDNNLITIENSNLVANWKLNRSEIKFNFNTLVVPYVEVGDTCIYQTKYGDYRFIPTRIEFSNSILQNIEGE